MPLDLTNENEKNNQYNKDYLFERIKQVKAFLKLYISQQEKAKKTTTQSSFSEDNNFFSTNESVLQQTNNTKSYVKSDKSEDNHNEIRNEVYIPSDFEVLSKNFRLTQFEEWILLLCIGIELDSEISKLCSQIHKNTDSLFPTFGLALSVIPSSTWEVLSPSSSLRFYGLIEIFGNESIPLVLRPIRITEQILHFCLGIKYYETLLRKILRPVNIAKDQYIVNSHKMLIGKITKGWKTTIELEKRIPIVQLIGKDESSKLLIANEVCKQYNLSLMTLSAENFVSKVNDFNTFSQLLNRDSLLFGFALYLPMEDLESQLHNNAKMLIESISVPIFLGTYDPLNIGDIYIDVYKPEKKEQKRIWEDSIENQFKENLSNVQLEKLITFFDFNTENIKNVLDDASLSFQSDSMMQIQKSKKEKNDNNNNKKDKRRNDILFKEIWNSGKKIAKRKVKEFAEYVDSHLVNNNDLILPESEKKLLQNIISYMTNYYKISDKSILFSNRRIGMNAVCLFSGPSGTGKTMAAQVIANSLDLELFRLDLASVMSKWVGQTEKNIRKLFDAAANGGVCLLIDECDTLLHKRSSGELHDSVERYGNSQISYMLQKIEEFQGLIILTSNMKDAIDSAFTRRIMVQCQFRFPTTSERKQIWERLLSSLNISDIDLDLLSKLDIAGGNIQKIVLNAALLSAGSNSTIDMNCIKEAVKIEYAKLEKPLVEKELLFPKGNVKNEKKGMVYDI